MIQLSLVLLVILVAIYFLLPDHLFSPGRGRARYVLDQFMMQNGGACTDAGSRELVSRIGSRLSAPARERLNDVEFSVVRSAVPNACAIGDHHICVTEGLIDLMGKREALLAPIVAHELGHILAGHAARRWKDHIFLTGFLYLLIFVFRSPWLVNALGLGKSLALSKFSRAQEFEADASSVWLCQWAGYDPREAAEALRRVGAWYENKQVSDPITQYFASHPPIELRVEEVKRLAGEIEQTYS